MAYSIQRGYPPALQDAAADLYWQAFRGKLQRLLGPDAAALGYFRATLDPHFALAAIGEDRRLLGIAGLKTTAGAFTDTGGFASLARHYGWPSALWRAPLLALLNRKLEAETLLMDGLCVDPAARGLGIGSALLVAVEEEARTRGLRRVRLDVIDSNPRAKALYARQGYEAIAIARLGPLKAVFGFANATTMTKTVAQSEPRA